MPGFTTHYLFGTHMYHRLKPCALKTTIKSNLPAYLLGLQGPDFFFYHLPILTFVNEEKANKKQNLGSLLHTAHSSAFFSNYLYALEHLENSRDRDIGLAYFSGFLCHYILDANSHPFIYARTNYKVESPVPGSKVKKRDTLRYLSIHIDYETNLDTLLLKKYKSMQPSAFHQSQTICVTTKERRLISRLLSYSIRKTFFPLEPSSQMLQFSPRRIQRAIFSMKLGCIMLSDSTGLKKKFIKYLESKSNNPHFISNLIPSKATSSLHDYLNLSQDAWYSPWKLASFSEKVANTSFLDLYHQAEKKCSHTLHILNQYAKCSYTLTSYIINKEKLLKHLGNCSYHSGLPLKEDDVP